MSLRSEQLLQQALALPADERAQLIDRLIAHVSSPIDPRIESLWAEEAERRIAAFDCGEIKAIPAGEVFKQRDGRRRLEGLRLQPADSESVEAVKSRTKS